METINQTDIRTISMVKLGQYYYALKDAGGVTKTGLERALSALDPTTPVTKEELTEFCQPCYYGTLSAAAEAINTQTPGGSATGGENTPVAVYYGPDGEAVVVLTEDITVSASVSFQKPVRMWLNGKTLSLGTGAKLNFLNDTDTDGAAVAVSSVIDGRAEGSQISKVLTEESSSQEMVVDCRSDSLRLLGGQYILDLAQCDKPSVVLLGRGTTLSAEGCVFQATQSAGSGMVLAVRNESAMELRDCTVSCTSAQGIAYGLRTTASTGITTAEGCQISSVSQENAAYGVYADNGIHTVRDCQVTTASQAASTLSYPVAAVLMAHSAADQEITQLILDRCRITASAANTIVNGLKLTEGTAKVTDCRIHADSQFSYAYAVHNQAAAVTEIADTHCFADAASGENNTPHSVGILNYGNLTLDYCSAYGTHCGMQLLPASVTHCTGGTFEGVGHGGIHFSHMDGSAFIQDASIQNARYRGSFKDNFSYDSQYHTAGLYVGNAGDTTVSNTSAYLDNCQIDGSTGSAIVLRGTGGETNNAVYLSNCDVTGSDIRIDSDTHRLYIGKACHVVPAADRPGCVTETDALYLSVPAAVEETGTTA